MPGSVYVHIPFCKRKCIYCNFYSRIYEMSAASIYTDALLSQLSGFTGTFDTIYIGGGTPTAIDAGNLARLIKSLSGMSGSSTEFTVEANPESLDREKLKILSGGGVNRLSIGIQSLKEDKLKKLGRIHNAKRAADSVLDASKAGFGNISIDLMFGVWGESPESWRTELEEAVKLPVKHVSCYELTYENGTPLFGMLKNRAIEPQPDDVTAGMYEKAIELLSLNGIKQYEVSNFAVPGYESRHNMNYWNNYPYTGLGASAFSYDGKTRSRNIADADEYSKRVLAGAYPKDFSETLSPEKRARETAAVKIRTRDGIDFSWFKEQTGYDLAELGKRSIPKLVEDGLIRYVRQGDRVTGINLKRKGMLHCDTVSSSLL